MSRGVRKNNTQRSNDPKQAKSKARNTKIRLQRFLDSTHWGNRQIELLLLRNRSPSYFVGDIQGLKDNWPEIQKFDSVFFGLNPSSINPVNRNCIVRGPIGRKAKSITGIDFVYVDVDPVRPPDVCATAEEKRKAKSVAVDVQKYLVDVGFPPPWVFDSGNGFHMLYPCRLEPQDVDLIKRLLELLSDKYDTVDVKVDQSVSDLPRVCRLPSTWNRKGANRKERHIEKQR